MRSGLAVRVASVATILAAGAGVAFAAPQTDLTTPPANILLPNYNTVPVGPNAGLESGAYVARVGDPSAAWINPAGLSRGHSAELSGSSGLYQFTTVNPSAFSSNGGSLQDIPSLVGFTVPKLLGDRWTLGVAVLTPNSWTQGTDAQIIKQSGDGEEHFAFSADSQFEQVAVAGSVGYAIERWRVGAGLALVETNISRNAVVSDRVASQNSLTSVLIASRASGDAIQVRPLAGVQYEASTHLLFGGMVRMPAITLLKSGSYTSEGVADGAAESQGLSFFDPNARFTYRFPVELHGGAAYVSPRLEIETDVHAFTSVGTYTLLSSDQPIITYADTTTTTPTIGTQPFTGFVSQSRGVVNVSAGGHIALSASGAWRLHFGAETDLSPVGSADQVFTRVNLYGGTIGVSGTRGGFQFTVGVNYRSGSSGEVALRPLPGNETSESIIRIRTIGLIYALSYKF